MNILVISVFLISVHVYLLFLFFQELSLSSVIKSLVDVDA